MEFEGGITPAYAGKTLAPLYLMCGKEDHPRLRGKDVHLITYRPEDLGSPPLTRERRLKEKSIRPDKRITPAYAGKTQKELGDLLGKRDHPRLRGKDL